MGSRPVGRGVTIGAVCPMREPGRDGLGVRVQGRSAGQLRGNAPDTGDQGTRPESHPDTRAPAVRVLGNPRAQALIPHGIVVGAAAGFLAIEPIDEARSPPGRKGRPDFGGRPRGSAGYRRGEIVRSDTGWPPTSP